MLDKFIFSIFTNLIVRILTIISFYLLILNFSPAFLGLWIFLNSIINIGFLFIDVGLDNIYYQYSGKKNYSETFSSYLTLKIFFLLLNISISISLLFIFSIYKTEFFLFCIFILLSKIFVAINIIFITHLKTCFKVYKAELPYLITNTIHSILIIFLVNLNINSFFMLFFLSLSYFILNLTIFLCLIILSKDEIKITKPEKKTIITFLKDTNPLIIYCIITIICANIGNFIIAYSFGYETLGYVSLVDSYIIMILLSISASVVPLYLVLSSQYFEKNDYNSITILKNKIEKYFSIFYLLIIIIVIINAEFIFSIFLPNYSNSIPILNIMIFVPYFIGLSRPTVYLFLSGKRQKLYAIINSLIKILIITLMIILIPKSIWHVKTLGLGGIGFAIANTIPWILWCLLCYYFSYRIFKIKPRMRNFLHLPLALFIILLTILIKNQIFILLFDNQIILFLVLSVFSLGLFTLILFLLQELKWQEIISLVQLFRNRTIQEEIS